jgi:hypothetical protein
MNLTKIANVGIFLQIFRAQDQQVKFETLLLNQQIIGQTATKGFGNGHCFTSCKFSELPWFQPAIH